MGGRPVRRCLFVSLFANGIFWLAWCRDVIPPPDAVKLSLSTFAFHPLVYHHLYDMTGTQ